MKTLLLIFFSLFYTSVFSQQFFNEIKTDKDENPLIIKELSTKEILVAVNLSDTNANYNLYKLDDKGHILNSAAFIAIDSVWQLKAIHETSYGYLLCNQIRSRKNKRTVFLKLIGIDKNLKILFNRNHLIVDSATLSHEVTSSVDELNMKYVCFSTIHYESVNIPFKFYYTSIQYDELGNIVQSSNYSPAQTLLSHKMYQNIKLKKEGDAIALVYYSNQTHQLFFDSSFKLIHDTIPYDNYGNKIDEYNYWAGGYKILNDSSILFSNNTPDTSNMNHPSISIFRNNETYLNKDLFYLDSWREDGLRENNLAYDENYIISAFSYEHYGSTIDDSKIVISKFDYQLNLFWEKEIYSSTYLNVLSVIILSDGSILILTQKSDGTSKWNTYIFKISDNGILLAVSNLSMSKNIFKIYPNPGNKFITIEGIETDNLNLVDVLGNSFSLKSTNNIFETNDLPSGMYFYQLTEKNTMNHFSGKWMKE